MANRQVDDMLKHPESIRPQHTCNFGDPYLKFRGLVAAKLYGCDFNTLIRMALDQFLQSTQKKRGAEFEALLRQFPYRSQGIKKKE